jgi:hypothetical protein
MEYIQIEAIVVETLSPHGNESKLGELNDLQLALVGGGNAVVLFN